MRISPKGGHIKTTAAEAEKTTLNISLTVEEKKFLKVYAAQNGLTVSGIIQNYIGELRKRTEEQK